MSLYDGARKIICSDCVHYDKPRDKCNNENCHRGRYSGGISNLTLHQCPHYERKVIIKTGGGSATCLDCVFFRLLDEDSWECQHKTGDFFKFEQMMHTTTCDNFEYSPKELSLDQRITLLTAKKKHSL